MSNNTSARNFVPISSKYDRVVLLVDMDCFYCQVEEKLDPSLKNQPLAVVQYNAWRGGGIIAVNYAARAKGVTRHMRGDEAKEQCPEIQLVKVPNVREKADLTKYREAGKEVANVLQRFTPLLERASVDEAYLDITDSVNKRLQAMNDGTFVLQPQELVNTYAVGFSTIEEFVTTITSSFITSPLADDDNFYRNFHENDVPAVRQSNIRLLLGASIASEIRSAVKAETSYECSAGIAHNKILAKLACGINKPNKQTILPLAQISGLFETLPVGKIKGLGAKFGEEVCERLGIRYLGQLLKFTEAELQKKFDEKNGTWLYNICRGIDLEAVTPRFYSKSIGCCKKFPGRNNITGIKTLQHWLNELANEINERLEKDICENNRRAKQMVVNFIQEFDGEEVSSSRSAPLQCYDTEVLAKASLEIIKANTKQFFRSGSESVLNNPIKFLGISVGKFETISNSQNNIQQMFAQQAAKKQRIKIDNKEETNTSSVTSNSATKTENKSTNNNAIKEVPKESKNQNMKSFFLNALKKEPQKEHKTAIVGQSNMNGISKPTSSSQVSIVTKPQDKFVISHDDSNKPVPQKSFFAKVLRKNEESTKSITSSSSTTEALDISSTSNANISSNELNDLIDDINAIQNEENIQNENNNSCNNLINTDIQINSNDSSCHENKLSKPKSFFARVLRKSEDLTKSLESSSSTTDTLNISSNSKANDNSNELNDIINNINTIQSEETEYNSMKQYENNPSCNNLINAEMAGNNSNILMSTMAPASKTVPINMKRKYDAITDNEENKPTDYRSQYAEFAIPEFRPEFLQFTNCSKCGAKILNDPTSIQTHQDHHFAQELSQQQRHEFRDEIRTKINSSKSPPVNNKKSKKAQLHNNTIKKTLNADITKFLKPSTLASSTICEQNQSSENSNTPNMVICDICKLPISIDEILEHKDFHMAKDLQRKLNQLEVNTVEVVKKPVSNLSRKSLNSSMMAPSRSAKVTAKPITQFFTQSNT
ncbi:DNA polymerase eta [Lucilia sericata]|uniref:DNA polymerase eta n=1 Tax=Lucilia sericata TaxID=13632 RepID=UPI0018A83E04|nr:DNA polymerase eta [Lucilia sericata]